MGSTIAVIVVVAVLTSWRLRLRRHPNWATNDDARFHISAGTWLTLIALYWFLQSRLAPDWVWKVWPVLAVGSLMLLMRGVDDLAAKPEQFVALPPSAPPRDRHTPSGLVSHRARHP
ncbi:MULTISPECIES: hypothetical protein [unclassified Mycolicibacterium]|uniref:hypothetical protein n=1 Tax=unclassified Mycolicibacterium TaxID=2636767 RepID=UPI0012DE0D31|nr:MULTISPECIES: hypothetical protein [unclassified Mycolicibacterium]MUL81729.1 hypothetical protein [Mycolicibacterium sp. CBMA 329]MUL87495.1 hypothetical protein [Mycolicibacterium sp. CBMA 331]MUL99640.1 hypothetical protein [Mycolicibacterium sp. CBMA 334]MUM26737.1 hypothetical protein [Mycolicibacterium sp. CBMA 295]MUM37792.1 hypothetical protein [Mycolicibacterium sp. CBMA 247]